jgi:imidazolonepropionase-like amidohydrolase
VGSEALFDPSAARVHNRGATRPGQAHGGPQLLPHKVHAATGEAMQLLAGWCIDGSGGQVRENVLLTVAAGRIVGLQSVDGTTLPGDDAVDCREATIIPALVDCHVHLFMSGTADAGVRREQLQLAFAQARPMIDMHLRRHLACGIVAVRDGGDYAGHALHFKEHVLPVEDLPIRLKAAGRAWRAPGRYGALIGRPPPRDIALAEAILRQEDRPDHVKIVNSGLNSLTHFAKETPPQFEPGELARAVHAARRLGLRTMVHANGRLAVSGALDARCDSIEHGFFMGLANLEKMAERRVVWVPTVFTMQAYADGHHRGSIESATAQRNVDHQLGQLSLARRLGVPVALGTDCGSLGVDHGEAFAEELKLLLRAGYSVPEAVRCATVNGARLLGLHDLGELRSGMEATFVVVPGPPDALPEALKAPLKVCIGGAFLDSRNKPRLPIHPRWSRERADMRG